VGWLITVFSMPGIFLMPLMGIGADLFGRRNVVGLCLILFGAAGGACFFVHDFHWLIVLRFIQGIGAAPLSSLNIAFISDMYRGHRRDTAMGFNQAVLSVGAAVFTTIGGALATLGWAYPFLLPLLGIPIGLLVLFKLQVPKQVPVSTVGSYFRKAARTITRRELIACYLITVLGLIVVWGAYINYFPILMSVKHHRAPFVIGLTMTVMTVCSAVSSSQMGKLSTVMSGRRLFFTSFGLYALALTLILVAPVAIFGIAQGIFIPNIQNYLARLSTMENRGAVMALYGTAIRMGQTLGPFLMGLAFPLSGLNGVFFLCAMIALALILFAAVMFAPRASEKIDTS
jgi:MFS family permease